MTLSTTNTASARSAGEPDAGPTPAVRAWIDESASLLKPDKVVWCDGSLAIAAPTTKLKQLTPRGSLPQAASIVVTDGQHRVVIDEE